ncbi:hypothetical protein Purlil1_7813 [Purpureocillium lilacinum]|uniref:Uncharacterized protein n=1 Tax=Purpureocillium lilacinum TaxID=33203 RepID=A0ABR0BV48_PURLI|nr:hypothetical protein Purlil1_7813 [Purpureocillium lilacinum]
MPQEDEPTQGSREGSSARELTSAEHGEAARLCVASQGNSVLLNRPDASAAAETEKEAKEPSETAASTPDGTQIRCDTSRRGADRPGTGPLGRRSANTTFQDAQRVPLPPSHMAVMARLEWLDGSVFGRITRPWALGWGGGTRLARVVG